MCIRDSLTWKGFDQRNKLLSLANRIKRPKDLYDFVRPTRFGTVEVRCCDLPANLDQVIALAGVVQTLVAALAVGDCTISRSRDILESELHQAMTLGPNAMLLDGENKLMKPQEWLGKLASIMQPFAEPIGTHAALQLAPSFLARNGSDQQVASTANSRTAASRHLGA